ncbi:Na+/H+ antiporter NhaC family protein [Galactobacillus timonensis]|uniref:Na+/H+ antiporter NhaC family protein n=1 Tax=Galactobacillus timonensis TaxID=2041840 RepID=UPI0010835F3A|nr:Na+/H+ antiporter NhaC family protein [Galactobacillus timonensis]
MANVVETYHMNLHFMPAVFFVVALLLAFSTGTSWGTFAIMLPITTAVFGDLMTPLTVITTAAVLGGSVCGDHVSPIFDTTILSSTGAQCNHLNHVSSQLQYGAVAAIMTLGCYLITGWINNALVGLVIGICGVLVFALAVKKYYGY